MRGKRVLLVEDNALNREISRELLEGEGFAVEEAADGDEAVEKLWQEGPAGTTWFSWTFRCRGWTDLQRRDRSESFRIHTFLRYRLWR